MLPEDVAGFFDTLSRYRYSSGYVVVTWGGTASDFRVLHSLFRRFGDDARANAVLGLALDHIDIPLCTVTTSGHMMGLASVCKGMMIPMEKGADSSRLIPTMWTRNPEMVLRHVLNDAWATLRVFDIARNQHPIPNIRWITRRENLRIWEFPEFFTVGQCMAFCSPTCVFTPHPPRDRESCTRWIRFERDASAEM